MSKSKATWENLKFYLTRRVYVHGEHWLWIKGKDSAGYGWFTIDGKMMLAHRASYLIFIGPIPENKPHVLHTCDIKKCIQPKHLYAGTHQDNMDDRFRRRKQLKVLLSSDHLEIHRRYLSGERQEAIAQDYKVSQSYVSLVVLGLKG